MRIAIFSDNFYPELSGITDSITLLGKELAKRGHSILFIAPRYSKRDYAKSKFPAGEQDYDPNISVARLPSIGFPASPTGQGRIALPVGAGISILKKFKPDIIHTQSPFGAGIEALLDAKILRIPIIGTNHTPIVEFMRYSPFKPAWFVNGMIRFYSWYYNACSFVSAPCKALLDDMSRHGFHLRDSRPVPNPTDVSIFSPVKNDAERGDLKQRFRFSPHTILYTGRIAPEKKIDVILATVAEIKKEMPDICFAITGHGNWEKELHALVEKLGLSENVRFLGYVAADILPSVYQAADMFVIMSTAETQSLSMMQAMASALPVIGARAWGLPEFIDTASGIVVAPDDISELAQTVVELFKNPSRMRTLGNGGVISVKKYIPASVASEWGKIYSQASIAG